MHCHSRSVPTSWPRTVLSFSRRCLAIVLGVLAFVCLWTGLDPKLHFPVPSEATAGSGVTQPGFLPGPAGAFPGHPLPRAVLLQAAVDSVALSLGGSLSSLEQEEARRAVVVKALDALTFDLGEDIHFTAWEGARLMHSPLSPDAADLDFAAMLDIRGKAFVQAMRECGSEGGFVRVILPRRQYALGSNGTAGSGSITDREAAPDWYGESVRLVHTESEVSMLVYTRAIPASNWQISAFMAKPNIGEGHVPRADGTQPFSSVWSIPALQTTQGPDQDDLRKGLLVSGLSLTGLAGLLLTPGFPRRKEE